MRTRHFCDMLEDRQTEIHSQLCVGLDPLADKVPHVVQRSCASLWSGVALWMREIVDATAPAASLFKPNHAHWEAIPNGLFALQVVIDHIHYRHPDIPILLDCKRGDIGRTQERYREAHFTLEGVDGINYNGYMGRDTLQGLIDPNYPGRALVGLGRTSNPDAWPIQDVLLADGRRFWEFMVENLYTWSNELGVIENAGIVMGAAHEDPKNPGMIYSAHLSRAREIVGGAMWFLIPGIGRQQGYIDETVQSSYWGPGSIAVNSSSDIIFASDSSHFAEIAGQKAEETRKALEQAVGRGIKR